MAADLMSKDASSSCLAAHRLTVGYGGQPICADLDVRLPDGRFTVIIGPNGCGKSTLLRSLARLIRPSAGEVRLDGRLIQDLPTREVARRIGLLPQSAVAPDDILVSDLVARGRHPHRQAFAGWTEADERAVQHALEATNTLALAERAVDSLSGGQRQRVWIALALAQETPLLLLDEPTTFLDIAHQVELMELLCRLNREGGRTLVAVLHDLNQACRYADHIIALRAGRILAEGPPAEVVTPELIEALYGLKCAVIENPLAGTPLVIPY
ncbi:ABC transporter ATP-binding protein [Pseudomonas oryzihabitans]|uniref:ABC transporter ATP-binding protein n=1 Tax=Pseudomonas oryzihabitans TaxID=47885 RepID=UPI00241E9AEC|nr:ABC transporter ATP-binding protein [Pseudomonas oryzihabitans]